jgi:hypothetical protein
MPIFQGAMQKNAMLATARRDTFVGYDSCYVAAGNLFLEKRRPFHFSFAVKHSIQVAQKVYELLGAKDHLGVHYSHHGHAFTPGNWDAMMDFFDKCSRGMNVHKTFDHFLTEAGRKPAILASGK